VLDQLHAAWQHFEGQLRDLAKRLKEFAATAPPREAEARAKLRTAPGVGPVTVDVVVSELGDVGRFHSAKAVCAYAGLVPGVRGRQAVPCGRDDHRTTPYKNLAAVPSPTTVALKGGVPWIQIAGDVRSAGRSRIDG
jgi:hypothetical protein